MSDKKKIYVVVTQTGTVLSRILKRLTHDKYNHVSLSLTESLDTLYSFGRKNPYNPFWGGFVRESPTSGTFARFYNTDAMVLELEVDSEVYDALERDLLDMYERREEYKYNYAGLLAGFVGKNVRMQKRYYCSEFVQYILAKYNIGLKRTEGEIVRPNDFENLPSANIIYIGKLRAYARCMRAEI